MRSALVLNATYEPLSVVSARRAACLVLADKADSSKTTATCSTPRRLRVPCPS